MDVLEDKALLGKSISSGLSSAESNPYADGLHTIELSDKQVDVCGNFLSDFYQRRRKSKKYKDKQVTRTAPTMLKGALFAIGTRKLSNPEWKEHCASSIREIFHEWKEGEMKTDFNDFYRNGKPKLNDVESTVFIDFKLHYDYFCGIDHHEASGILGSLTAILKNTSLKLEDCYKDELFLERVKNFFQILTQIIELSEKQI
jgi:hypothetical protein